MAGYRLRFICLTKYLSQTSPPAFFISSYFLHAAVRLDVGDEARTARDILLSSVAEAWLKKQIIATLFCHQTPQDISKKTLSTQLRRLSRKFPFEIPLRIPPRGTTYIPTHPPTTTHTATSIGTHRCTASIAQSPTHPSVFQHRKHSSSSSSSRIATSAARFEVCDS